MGSIDGGTYNDSNATVVSIDLVGALMGFANVQSFASSGPGRAWQGCATDGTSVWLITDRTVRGYTQANLSNCIERYNMAGVRQAVSNNVYSGRVGGKLWNFVDGTFYGGHLWICCTNFHSNTPSNETACQVLRLDPADYSVVATYPLTTLNGSIESLARRGDEWWVCWSGSASVRRYNADFSTLIGTYAATPQAPLFGTHAAYGDEAARYYQGIEWVGDLLHLSLHGANDPAVATAPGVEVFRWTGSALQFRRTLTPPTYGAGQGMCRTSGGKWWFSDRAADTLVSCDLVATKTATQLNNAARRFHADCSRTWIPIPAAKAEIRAAFDTYDISGDHGMTLGAADARFVSAYGAF